MTTNLKVVITILMVVGIFIFSGNFKVDGQEMQATWTLTSDSQIKAETLDTKKDWVLGTPLGPGNTIPPEITAKAVSIIQAKRAEKGITLKHLSEITGRSPVYIAAALRGQARLHQDAAQKVAVALGLDAETAAVLTACPIRDQFPCTTDPLKYRLFEVIGVYGDAIRDACNELFGDGIMSAITFKLNVDKEAVDGTDYVVITLKGKWLPYKEF